jgi:hypothetical protein
MNMPESPHLKPITDKLYLKQNPGPVSRLLREMIGGLAIGESSGKLLSTIGWAIGIAKSCKQNIGASDIRALSSQLQRDVSVQLGMVADLMEEFVHFVELAASVLHCRAGDGALTEFELDLIENTEGETFDRYRTEIVGRFNIAAAAAMSKLERLLEEVVFEESTGVKHFPPDGAKVDAAAALWSKISPYWAADPTISNSELSRLIGVHRSTIGRNKFMRSARQAAIKASRSIVRARDL